MGLKIALDIIAEGTMVSFRASVGILSFIGLVMGIYWLIISLLDGLLVLGMASFMLVFLATLMIYLMMRRSDSDECEGDNSTS